MDTKTIKKKPGRPTTTSPRTESIRLPLSADEKGLIQAAAMLRDLQPAVWARSALLKAARLETGE